MWSLFSLGLVVVCALLFWRQRVLAKYMKELVDAIEDGKTYLLERNTGIVQSSNFERLVRAANSLVAQSARSTRAQHDYLRQVEITLGNIKEAVLIIDSDNYVVLANDVLRQFLGKEQPLLGRRLETLIPSAAFLDYVRSVKAGEKRFSEEIEFRKGKEVFWFEVNGSRMPKQEEDKGQLTLFVLHDVSRRKRLETMRTEFVANVSHELRTPVTIIKGFAETLVEDHHILSAEDRERFLLKIQKNVARLHTLLEDLLILSRLEAAVEPLMLETQDLSDLVREIVDNFRGRLNHEQKLQVVCEPGSLIVNVDAMRLTQVVENLLENSVRHAKPKLIQVHLLPSTEGIRCLVEDDGCGIPEADLPHIFERFFRVDKGRSRETGGTGLGLSIVKHIVLQHGGHVLAESVLQQGSKIGFFLPYGFGQKSPESGLSPF